MKNNKKRIYRPRDYMKALLISLIVGSLCIFITAPILIGAVQFKGIQISIDKVKAEAEAEEFGWTDERTALSDEYEAKREKMAQEDAIIDWCYRNSKTTFSALIRNIVIGVCGVIYVFGAVLTMFLGYCIGRDIRQCGIPYIVNLLKCAWIKRQKSKAEKVRAKVYEQFGIEMK